MAQLYGKIEKYYIVHVEEFTEEGKIVDDVLVKNTSKHAALWQVIDGLKQGGRAMKFETIVAKSTQLGKRAAKDAQKYASVWCVVD